MFPLMPKMDVRRLFVFVYGHYLRVQRSYYFLFNAFLAYFMHIIHIANKHVVLKSVYCFGTVCNNLYYKQNITNYTDYYKVDIAFYDNQNSTINKAYM